MSLDLKRVIFEQTANRTSILPCYYIFSFLEIFSFAGLEFPISPGRQMEGIKKESLKESE